MRVEDQPHHHNIDCYVAAAQLWSELTEDDKRNRETTETAERHKELHIWGHDHDGAYRK